LKSYNRSCHSRPYSVSWCADWSARKEAEKLEYMHNNPVERGLVAEPEQWEWSSYRWYAYREVGRVKVMCQEWPLEIRRIEAVTFG
jgi:hypothetical protein